MAMDAIHKNRQHLKEQENKKYFMEKKEELLKRIPEQGVLPLYFY